MKSLKLKQALYYRLHDFGWSSLTVYAIAIVITIAIGFLLTANTNGVNSVRISSIEAVGFVHMLLMGITGIRSDLRFFIQHGISRRTTFYSHLFGSLICSAALGLFCVVLSLISYHWFRFDFYGAAFQAQKFFSDWTMLALMFFLVWQFGALISLIYYRLNKIQQIVFSVTVVAAVIFASSQGILRLVGTADNLDQHTQILAGSGVGTISWVIVFGLLCGLLAIVGNYLLLKRVPIKE